MGVRLLVVDDDGGALFAAAVLLRTSPEQARFARPPAESFPEALADPARTAFVVVDGEERVVGAGVLDTAAPARDAELAALLAAGGHDAARAVLLRSFVIDAAHQGRGLGTAAARASRALAQQVPLGAPSGAGVVVLTVNERNPAGRRAYERAGFADAGRYLGGDAGPQRAMVARCG